MKLKIIKVNAGGLANTMRSGCHERIAAVWGVEVNGQLLARIFTLNGNSMVVDATSGRSLYDTAYAPRQRGQSRVAIAKNWAIQHFNNCAEVSA